MNLIGIVSRLGRAGGILSLLWLSVVLPSAVRGQEKEVVINEVLASNHSIAPLAELPDYFPDYVELYNATANDIDLGFQGWSLSTKRVPLLGDFKDFFHFPLGTVIPADSFLLVFFDNETNY